MTGSTVKQSQEETILRLLAANHSLEREIAELSKSCDEWRAIASGKATENAALRAEITTLREKLDDVVQACAPLQSGGDLSERVGMRWGESITTDGVRRLCAALREADAEIERLRAELNALVERCEKKP